MLPHPIQAQQVGAEKIWTDKEKKAVLAGLERTKKEVFEAIKGLTVSQWNFKESARGNDDIFIAYVDDPQKADAGFLSPIGKYCTREKAEFAFNRVRSRIYGIVDGTNEDLRKHFTFRRFTNVGQLSNAEKYNLRDLHQLLLTCLSHTDRHLKQLRRVKQHPNYPK
jgi:hypothetical protein